MRSWRLLLTFVLVGACGGGSSSDTETADAAASPREDAAACDGCLDHEGECVAGTAHEACGHSGESCHACAAAEECAEGVCETPPACGPANCTGCCDGDSCLSGSSAGACGAGGLACAICDTGFGETCADHHCVSACGPDTCSGCCDGDICRSGQDDGACGSNGESCSDCGSDTCSWGECVSSSCADSCAGCCSGPTCLGGEADDACGVSGSACLDCGNNRICASGACVVDPNSRWDVVVVSGEVNENNTDYEPWDSFGGLPDPYVCLIASDSPDVVQDQSGTDDDTLLPYWNDVVLSDVPARMLQNYFYIHVYDDDIGATDDYMGQCAPEITDASFSDTLLTLVCPRDTAEGEAGFTVRYRIRPH